jgi:hypothetical protein
VQQWLHKPDSVADVPATGMDVLVLVSGFATAAAAAGGFGVLPDFFVRIHTVCTPQTCKGRKEYSQKEKSTGSHDGHPQDTAVRVCLIESRIQEKKGPLPSPVVCVFFYEKSGISVTKKSGISVTKKNAEAQSFFFPPRFCTPSHYHG